MEDEEDVKEIQRHRKIVDILLLVLISVFFMISILMIITELLNHDSKNFDLLFYPL
jgi:hypothetical protein